MKIKDFVLYGQIRKILQQDGRIPTSIVMFIPSTRGGLRIRMMRERDHELAKITGFKVKMQEAGGVQLARQISTELAKVEPCGREDCQSCKTSEKRPN